MTRARTLADYVAGGTTAAEFDYLDGVTSNVQTQMDAKAPLASPAFTGNSIEFGGNGTGTDNSVSITNNATDTSYITIGGTSTAAKKKIRFCNWNGVVGDISTSGSGTIYNTGTGGGITFSSTNTPAQSSGTGSHNTLDDYEEGTFTPALSSGTRVGSSFIGTYTKIGRMVHIVIILGDINASSASAYSASSNQYISGLPFTSVTHTGASGGLSTSYSIRLGGVGENILEWRVNSNNTTCTGHWFDTTGVGSNTIQSQWTTGGCGTYLTGSYLTA